jgi:hypothetical protein
LNAIRLLLEEAENTIVFFSGIGEIVKKLPIKWLKNHLETGYFAEYNTVWMMQEKTIN